MSRARFSDLLADGRPHLFDGGMGTMLYSRGVFINKCYDELSLSRPELVEAVHREYVRAGAELLETNTFGANAFKLEKYGLDGHVVEINARAAELARKAAGDAALVGGSIGPLGIRIEPYGPTALEEARACFRQQVDGLLEGGVQFFVLETFADLAEIRQALLAVRDACDLPIVAQMTVREDGTTLYGTAVELIGQRLDGWGADVVGLNCSVGPHGILAGVERLVAATDRPVSAQPNAGMPREIDGRKMYMASPEYMAKYTRRLIQSGARLVGGCCGTTPEHVRRMSDAVRALSPGRSRPGGAGASGATGEQRAPGESRPAGEPQTAGEARTGGAPQAGGPGARVVERVRADQEGARDPVPLSERSRFGRKLAAGELVTSVEIVPPRGIDPTSMMEGVRQLKRAGVDAVNVPDGPRAQMRMGVIATSVLIEREAGIEAVVHYTCRDRNLLGMLSDLLGAHALGIRNLLLITGDPPKMGPYPDATAVFDIDAIGLTNMVARLNHGLDPGGNPIGEATSYTIGVGVNPGALDRDHELSRFYWKVEAGAEYAITQPIFDADQLLSFVSELDKREIRIPIVAGIWPLVSARNAEFLANEVPGITVPDRVIERMQRAQSQGKEHALREGIAIARELFEAVRGEVQGIQVSAPFGKVPFALEVFEGVEGVEAAVDRHKAVAEG